MRGVHHNHVHARSNQRTHALFGFATRAHRRAHAQTAFVVFIGIGKFGSFHNIFNRNQAFKLVLVVQHQHALNLVLVHQFARIINAGANGHGNQFFTRRHNRANGQIQARFKTQIAVGNNADYLAVFHHRQARHLAFALLALCQQFADQFIGRHGNRVFHHAAFVAFHLANRQRLLLGRHVFMNDADAAFLRHRNRQTRFGNRIHCGGKDGQIERDFFCEWRFERDIAGKNLRMSRDEQNIVEGVGFFYDAHFFQTCAVVKMRAIVAYLTRFQAA